MLKVEKRLPLKGKKEKIDMSSELFKKYQKGDKFAKEDLKKM